MGLRGAPMGHRLMAGVCALLLGSIVALAASGASAQIADPPEYAATIDGALAEFQAGRWAEARALFQRAHAIFPNARPLRGIGMASFEMADYPAAISALEDALASTERPLTDEQRTQVTTLLERARALVSHYVVPAAPAGVRLSVDGVVVAPGGGWPAVDGELVLSVGTHEVVMRDGDGRTSRVRVVVRGGEDGRLELEPPGGAHAGAGGSAASADPAPWILLGVGAGLAIAGGVVYGVGAADIARVNGASRGTEWSSVSGVYDSAPVMTGVGLGVMLAGLGTAVVGAGWGIANATSSGDGGSARLSIGPLGASVEGTF